MKFENIDGKRLPAIATATAAAIYLSKAVTHLLAELFTFKRQHCTALLMPMKLITYIFILNILKLPKQNRQGRYE